MSALIRSVTTTETDTSALCSPLELAGLLDRGERARNANGQIPYPVHFAEGFYMLLKAALATIYGNDVPSSVKAPAST